MTGPGLAAGHDPRTGERQLRILIVAHDFPPLNSSASRRPYSWARAWADLGHDVHVLTTAKYDHDRSTDLGQDMSGFTVHPVRYLPGLAAATGAGEEGTIPRPVRPHAGAARAFDTFRRLTRSLRLGLGIFTEKTTLAYPPLVRAGRRLLAQAHFDLIVSTSGPDVCPMVAGNLARSSGVFWLSDYRDLWFDEFAVNRYALTTWFVNRLQSRLLRRADLVSTVSEGLAGYLERVVPGKVTVCYNGYIETNASAPPPNPSGAQLRIVYTGTFYPSKRDPAVFFSGVEAWLAERPDLRSALRVDFYGPTEEWVAAAARDRGLADVVTLHGSVTYAVSLDAQRSADILLFVDWMDDRAEGVLTGKLFEYLAAGRPILCIGSRASTEAARMILRCGAGRVATSSADVRKALSAHLAQGWACDWNLDQVRRFSRRSQAEALLVCAQARMSAGAAGRGPGSRRL